jgi:D-amino-acid dehydrogenase
LCAGKIHTGATVNGFETDGDRVSQALTDRGVFRADTFVLALGAESPILARKLGIQLSIYPIKGYSLTIPIGNRLSPPTIASVDEHNLVALSRFGDRIRVTATAEFAGYDISHKPSDFVFMRTVIEDLYPDGADY